MIPRITPRLGSGVDIKMSTARLVQWNSTFSTRASTPKPAGDMPVRLVVQKGTVTCPSFVHAEPRQTRLRYAFYGGVRRCSSV